MWGRNWKKNAHYIFYLHIFISWKKGRGSALNIISIFYTHHRISNKHMMTINFDTITNNYEVIYVMSFKKNRYEFSLYFCPFHVKSTYLLIKTSFYKQVGTFYVD